MTQHRFVCDMLIDIGGLDRAKGGKHRPPVETFNKCRVQSSHPTPINCLELDMQSTFEPVNERSYK